MCERDSIKPPHVLEWDRTRSLLKRLAESGRLELHQQVLKAAQTGNFNALSAYMCDQTISQLASPPPGKVLTDQLVQAQQEKRYLLQLEAKAAKGEANEDEIQAIRNYYEDMDLDLSSEKSDHEEPSGNDDPSQQSGPEMDQSAPDVIPDTGGAEFTTPPGSPPLRGPGDVGDSTTDDADWEDQSESGDDAALATPSTSSRQNSRSSRGSSKKKSKSASKVRTPLATPADDSRRKSLRSSSKRSGKDSDSLN